MSNDPDLLDEWVECWACLGAGTALDHHNLDVDCLVCAGDGGWEQHRSPRDVMPARFSDDYDPSPEPIDRSIQ